MERDADVEGQAILDSVSFKELLDIRCEHMELGDEIKERFAAIIEDTFTGSGLTPTKLAKIMLYNAIVSLGSAQDVEKELTERHKNN